MKRFFGYIRVSTAKQGEQGVSLQEQRDAITRYAERNNLEIAAWFEERETAAKRGRPVFGRMIKLLRERKTNGVIIHKIDRSARNLKDWADLGELIDQGIEVHFANESLDLLSRGGRLSADIQAVVASDYIRNLREETRKGFYGRLKQGLYPLPAPLGYVDKGAGKPKEPDPESAPLVRKAFELYSTGNYSLDALVEELYRLGLRNRGGSKVSKNGFSVILNNVFYVGLIRLRRTGETFDGTHEPLVPKSLFDRIQLVLRGKSNGKALRHDFVFRRLFACKHCEYSLVAERQKGHVYYRCHTPSCPRTCVREEAIESAILQKLELLQLCPDEIAYVQQKTTCLQESSQERQEKELNALNVRMAKIGERLSSLTDAYIDRMIEKEVFEERKKALLIERKELEEKLADLKANRSRVSQRLTDFLELVKNASQSYKLKLPEEKRDFLKIATSNRQADGQNVEISLSLPFSEVANRAKSTNGSPSWDIPRTWDRIIEKLIAYFQTNSLQETTCL